MLTHIEPRGYLCELLAARPDLLANGLDLDLSDIALYRADVDANHPHAEEGLKQALAVYTAYFHPNSAHNVATSVAPSPAPPAVSAEDPRIDEIASQIAALAMLQTQAFSTLRREISQYAGTQELREHNRSKGGRVVEILLLIALLLLIFATRAKAQGKDQLVIQLQNNGALLGTAGGVLKLNCAAATYTSHVWTCTSAGGGAAAWGSITGTLSSQTDLQTALTARELTANKDAASGYGGLTAGSLLKVAEFPALLGDCTTSAGAVTTTCGNAIARTGGTAKQVAISGGAATPIGYSDLPDVKVVPAGVCNNGIAGSGWSLGSGGTVACRAGTNNLGAYVQISDTASTFATFQVAIPEDWDSSSNPYIRFQVASTDATNAHTIIPAIQVACYKGDGTTTDDVAANAAHSLSTTTLNGNANRFWSTSNVQMNATDMTGCIAGALMQVTVGRATDTATNGEFYSATLTFPRLPAVQAN